MDQTKFDIAFLRMATVMADNLSKDPSTKVGAIITTQDNRLVSQGYNGLPKGIKETFERWQRPEKYEWVVHAEQNAIINAKGDVNNCTLFCTLKPCHRCLAHIINAGIRRIVWLRTSRPDSPCQEIFESMILDSGIEIKVYSDDIIKVSVCDSEGSSKP